MHFTLRLLDPPAAEPLRAALDQLAGEEEEEVRIEIQPPAGYRISGSDLAQLNALHRRFSDRPPFALEVSPVQASMLETIRTHAEAEGKYIRQTGGSGNYAHCRIRIAPNDAGKGLSFSTDIKDESIPRQYIRPIEEGIREALRQGILAGHPIVDVKAILCGGSFHPTDSNEMAFRFAASIAFREAARKASPVVLEPVMRIDADIPDQRSSAAIQEIHLHRGRIESISISHGLRHLVAIVPLVELLAASSLHSSRMKIEFAGYEEVDEHDPPFGDGAGVTANKPNHPRIRHRSSNANPEPEI